MLTGEIFEPQCPFYGESHALGLEDAMLLPHEVSALPSGSIWRRFRRLIILGRPVECGREVLPQFDTASCRKENQQSN